MNNPLSSFFQNELYFISNNITDIQRIGGLSSHNYKLYYNNNPYFVKICTNTYLHTDRKNELSILHKATEIGISPDLYYFSIESGNMVTRWINGRMPTLDDFKCDTFLYSLSSTLKKLNNLKCTKFFDPFNDIRKRLEACKQLSLPLPNSLDNLLDKLAFLEIKLNKTKNIGLCHNDLNGSNIIIDTHNLYFVDYEYSSMGDIFFDLATISWFLPKKSRKRLLTYYFGEFKECYYEKLIDYLYVVKFYNATWSLLKSYDCNDNYDYLLGANIIFDELFNDSSIRSINY